MFLFLASLADRRGATSFALGSGGFDHGCETETSARDVDPGVTFVVDWEIGTVASLGDVGASKLTKSNSSKVETLTFLGCCALVQQLVAPEQAGAEGYPQLAKYNITWPINIDSQSKHVFERV